MCYPRCIAVPCPLRGVCSEAVDVLELVMAVSPADSVLMAMLGAPRYATAYSLCGRRAVAEMRAQTRPSRQGPSSDDDLLCLHVRRRWLPLHRSTSDSAPSTVGGGGGSGEASEQGDASDSLNDDSALEAALFRAYGSRRAAAAAPSSAGGKAQIGRAHV